MDDPIENHHFRSIVERIERLEEEKKTIADDIKEVYAEAKGTGYDVKVLRKLIALRKRDADERAEEEAVLELYEQALGDLADTPLGRAAAPGFASRAPMARSTERYSECVSRPAQRQNPSEGEVGSAVRDGAPVSETATPEYLPAAQSESAAGSTPEKEADESASGAGESVAAQSAQFVMSSGEGEGVAPPLDPSPVADEPIKGLAAANAIAKRAAQPAAPKVERGDIDIEIPAFLRRTGGGNHPSFGDQA